MANIRPFSGWRYAPTSGNPALLTVPLGDAFDPERQAHYRANPYCSLHLLRAPSPEAAAATLAHWKRLGIIRQDTQPAYYPLHQTFRLPQDPENSPKLTRKGFLAWVKLDELPEAQNSGPAPARPLSILPHEATLPGPVQSGVSLLQAIQMQLAPIHGLYHDPSFALETLLEAYLQPPLEHFDDGQGVETRLGCVLDADVLAAVTQTLATKNIYLADGHHRLTAAQVYLQQQQQLAHQQGRALPADSPARYALMFLSNAAGPDLHILPTHRVLRLPPALTASGLIEALRPYFDLVPLPPKAVGHDLQAGTLQLSTPVGSYRLRLRAELHADSLLRQPLPPELRRLDYTLLHDLVIDQLIGIPYAEQWGNAAIRYLKDAEPAAQAGRESGYVAFLLGELALGDLMAACDAGAVLPPKSTYFYPKALTGLVMSSLV